MSERADQRLGPNFLGVLFGPGRTLPLLAQDPSARSGAAAMALLGIGWTTLLLLLWAGGHGPSFSLLPIARNDYYLVQALFMLPLLTALWWIHAEIAHRICRAAGGVGPASGVRTALGFAYAAPMLFAHVLPELAAYLSAGFDAMALVGRFSLGLAALWVWALSAAALRVAHGVGLGVAVGASFAGLLVQAILGGVFLR